MGRVRRVLLVLLACLEILVELVLLALLVFLATLVLLVLRERQDRPGHHQSKSYSYQYRVVLSPGQPQIRSSRLRSTAIRDSYLPVAERATS